jgi:Glycosyl hydrolases family 43.
MKQGFNPILPLDEYIPDGEPHVFGDRIYLFGSHDTEGGTRYCSEQNYVGWSASIYNPTDWRYEGEIFNANQDPDYLEGETNDLYAPDVVQGNDGKYYLYYNINSTAAGTSGHNLIKVAVCDTPVGRYEYLGFVRNPDGSVHKTYLMGDPAVINDDGIIRLYYGWSLSMVAADAHAQGKGYSGEEHQKYVKNSPKMELPEPGSPLMNQILTPLYEMLFHRSADDVKELKYPLMGANTIELSDDMMTVVGEPKRIIPGQLDTPKDSSFFGHAFYEAASIRKISGMYYFIYSSENSNELCYATSKYPDKDFKYGGTIISNGDVGYNGLKKEDRQNMTANDHGSLEYINGQWYIFHHRQTHKSTFSRQACVEKVEIKEDGSIDQVECTSMGFNDGPLIPYGEFPAPISCILTNGQMPHVTNSMLDADIPFITHNNNERFITDIKEGTKIGYKYFAFNGKTKVSIKTQSEGEGKFIIATDKGRVGEVLVSSSTAWMENSTEVEIQGIEALYFIYHGSGSVKFLSFMLE